MLLGCTYMEEGVHPQSIPDEHSRSRPPGVPRPHTGPDPEGGRAPSDTLASFFKQETTWGRHKEIFHFSLYIFIFFFFLFFFSMFLLFSWKEYLKGKTYPPCARVLAPGLSTSKSCILTNYNKIFSYQLKINLFLIIYTYIYPNTQCSRAHRVFKLYPNGPSSKLDGGLIILH